MAKKAKRKKVSKRKTKKKAAPKKPTKGPAPKKKGKKRLAKPKIIPAPPPPGIPEMVLEPEPAKGGGVPQSSYEPPPLGPRGTQYPRYAAGMYYTTDLQGVTVDQLHKNPLWSHYHIQTLYDWSREDQWIERRKANLERWQKAIEARIGSKLVQARMEDFEDVREVYRKMLKRLLGKGLKARSYEGMVNAFVKVAELMDTWSDRLSKEFVPEMPMGSDAGMGHMHEVKPSISPAEARIAAKAVMAERRNQFRLKQGEAEAPPEESVEVPAVEVQE